MVSDDVKDPTTLDPHKQFQEKNHIIVQQIYEGLVRFNSSGKIEGALAVSWERRDPFRIRFKLREGVQFHNGQPFDAGDVKFSIERYLNPETGFPALGFISSLDRVDIVDKNNVDVVTKFPDGLLLNRLAGFILIISKKYVEERGENILSTQPVGTGPFKFVSWAKGKEIILEANKSYWSSKEGSADELVFQFNDRESRLKQFITEKVDILTDVPGTMTYELQKNPKTSVVKIESFFTVLGHFNTSHKVLSDKRVRRALNYAVNRNDLIRYDLLGNGRIIASVALPGTIGYAPDLQPYPYDPEKAKQLLKEAGVKTPLHLKTLVVEQVQRTALIMSKHLEKIGVYLDLSIVPNPELVEKFQTEQWDMGISGFANAIAHIAFPLNILFYSRSPYSLLHSPEFDQKFEEASGTIDFEEQEKKFKALDRYVFEEALGLFTYQRINIYGVNRKVNFAPAITGVPYYFETTFKEKQ